MSIPQFKVTITHGGTGYDYINSVFTHLQVKKRENNYDVATLWFADKDSKYYEDYFDTFDEVKIYFKDATETAYTQVFGGYIRQVIPTVNQSGFLPQILCKGYGAALEETHCNRDYGLESSNSSLSQIQEICQDIITNFVNKSFADSNTGYALVNTYVSDYINTDIKYINNPYRTNLELLDLICQLGTAIGAGTTAGPHWIVDSSKRLLLAKIGDHAAGGSSPEEYWPDYWNTDAPNSTFVQGTNFAEYSIPDKAEEYANKIVLITDFRRPAYDYWTEDSGGASLWAVDGTVAKTDSNAHYVVGSHSLKIAPNDPNPCYVYFPSNPTSLTFDVTKWGSIKTIPTINFYTYFVQYAGTPEILLSTNTTARKTDYFHASIADGTLNTWQHHSYPIGPYYNTVEDTKAFDWQTTGNPSWSTINTIEFKSSVSGPGDEFYIDDLHFSGKIGRSAYDSTHITAKNEYQRVLIARNAMDDSCVASDDSGFAARIARAELLRRTALPKTIIFTTTRDMKAALAGQKLHAHAEKKIDNTYRIDSDMRITEIQHNLDVSGGYTHTVTATTDLLNSHAIGLPDQYAIWQENMFVNSAEAKNIRSGAEVDLLIPIMQKDYPT